MAKPGVECPCKTTSGELLFEPGVLWTCLGPGNFPLWLQFEKVSWEPFF